MSEAREVLSIAVFDALPGQTAEAETTMRALMKLLAEKDYSRDLLYRDAQTPDHFVLLRYWKSEAAPREAQEDPAVQRYWARLGHLIRIVKIYESLEEVGKAGT
jgi:quinol monooxygenase YgiN